MTGFTDEQADICRDALALLRAAADHDIIALGVVVAHLADDPGLTAALLAQWFVSSAEEAGVDLPAGAARWQKEAGL